MTEQYKKGTEPFFDIVMKGLKGYVDGDYFWDIVDKDATFEFMYEFPNFAHKINGRDAYKEWFEGYSNNLTSADGLHVFTDDSKNTVIIEYQVHGTTANGNNYDNRFCSIVTLKDGKIVYWRDYMDSLAVILAEK